LKILRTETLISCGSFATSAEWQRIRKKLHKAIRDVEWPAGSGKFTIYPQSGKKRGEGNGVKPIKNGLIGELRRQGWSTEGRLALKVDEAIVHRPGGLDAVFTASAGPVALEWETGNISSSHRALNKMSLGLLKGVLAAGILVVPSRELYKFLTDRIGNIGELEPYLDLWRALPCRSGILEIVVIEHDATSKDVPRIPKGTDGRAAG
jgi:hypothetical protein